MVSAIASGDPKRDTSWRVRLEVAARAGAFGDVFGQWVQAHAAAVRRACRRLARHQRVFDARTAADDLYAETLAAAFTKLPARLAGDAPVVVLGFVLTTCLRGAFERLKFRVRRRGERPPATTCRFDDLGATAFDPPSPDDGPDVQGERAERAAHLWAAIDALPPPLRAVVVFNRIEGRTLAQIAREHGVPVGTLKTRSVKALALLRGAIGGE